MHTRLALLAPLVALVAITALAACGDDDDKADSSASFCDTARSIDAELLAFETASDAASIRASLDKLVPLLDRFESSAPDGFEDDATIFATFFRSTRDGFAAVDYDPVAFAASDAGQAAFEGLESSDIAGLETYVHDECGVDTNRESGE